MTHPHSIGFSLSLLLSILLVLVLLNWRIDRTQAHQLQQVIDQCIYKHGFIIETKEDILNGKKKEIYGIVCGRAEEFHNSDITQPYKVWLPWPIKLMVP